MLAAGLTVIPDSRVSLEIFATEFAFAFGLKGSKQELPQRGALLSLSSSCDS